MINTVIKCPGVPCYWRTIDIGVVSGRICWIETCLATTTIARSDCEVRRSSETNRHSIIFIVVVVEQHHWLHWYADVREYSIPFAKAEISYLSYDLWNWYWRWRCLRHLCSGTDIIRVLRKCQSRVGEVDLGDEVADESVTQNGRCSRVWSRVDADSYGTEIGTVCPCSVLWVGWPRKAVNHVVNREAKNWHLRILEESAWSSELG